MSDKVVPLDRSYERRLRNLERGISGQVPPSVGLFLSPDGTAHLPIGIHSPPGGVITTFKPGPVTGLTLTPGAGDGDIWIDADWSMPTTSGDPIVSWSIEVLKAGDSLPLVFTPPLDQAPPYRIRGLEPNTHYTVTVRAISQLGAAADPVSASVDTASDSTAPAKVAGLIAGAGLKSITLSWTKVWVDLNPSRGRYEVRISTHADMTSPRVFDAGSGNVWSTTDLVALTNYWVTVTAVSASGVAGPASDTLGPISTGLVGNADLADLIITGPKIAPGAVSTEKLTVGTVSDNLIANGGFEDLLQADATKPARMTIVTVGAGNSGAIVAAPNPVDSGKYALALSVPTISGYTAVLTDPMPVTPGDLLYCSARVVANAVGAAMFFRPVWCTDDTTVPSDGEDATRFGYEGVTPPTGAFATYDKKVVVPATFATVNPIRYMRLKVWWFHPSSASTLFVDNVSARKAVVSAVIADGAVNTPQLHAGAITADSGIVANLYADVLTGGTLDFTFVRGLNLDVGDATVHGQLTAARLGAGTIGAYLIQLASGGIIRSANYVPGTSGWQIDGAGNIEAMNALLRGGVLANGRVEGSDIVGGSFLIPGKFYAADTESRVECIANLDIGHDYSGGVFAMNAAFAEDVNWGMSIDHPSSTVFHTKLRYFGGGAADERRAGVYDQAVGWAFFADQNTTCQARTAWGIFSSREIKKAIKSLKAADFDRLLELRPVSYLFRKGDDYRDHPRLGLVAEEVLPIIPEVIVPPSSDAPMSLVYSDLIPLLIGKLQDHEARLAAGHL